MPGSNGKRQGLLARFDLLSFLAGLAEKAITNSAAIASYIGGGALMGWLVYLEGVRPWMWGIGFFGGLVLVAIVRAISAYSQNQKAAAALRAKISETPQTVNPLRQHFDRERIRISDFWNPMFQLYKGVVFRDSQIHGPGTIAFWHGTTLRGADFTTCDMVCVTNALIRTAVVFENSTFENTTFVSMTLYIPRNMCDALIEDQKRRHLPPPEIIGYNEQPDDRGVSISHPAAGSPSDPTNGRRG
jgi:hypothetical protein